MRTVCPRSAKSFVHEDLVPRLVGGPYTSKIVTFCLAWSQEVPFFFGIYCRWTVWKVVEGVGSSSCECNLIFSFSKIILFPEKKFYLNAWIMVYGLKGIIFKSLNISALHVSLSFALSFLHQWNARCHAKSRVFGLLPVSLLSPIKNALPHELNLISLSIPNSWDVSSVYPFWLCLAHSKIEIWSFFS